MYFVPYILRAHSKWKSFFYVKMLKAELREFDKVFLFFKNFFNFKIQKYH